MTYQLYIAGIKATEPDAAMTINDPIVQKSFLFNVDNSDYQQFKIDLANGTTLNDITGSAMTADQIKTFLETLP